MEQEPQSFWNLPVYGGTPQDWLIALGLSAAIALAVYLFKPILIRRLSGAIEHSNTKIDDALLAALRSTRFWIIVIFAISIGSRYLELPDPHSRALATVTALALFLQAGLWANTVFKFWLHRSQEKALLSNASAATSLSAIGFLGQMALWTVVTLLALDNMGVNITALVAGLGVGGVAVALAVQNILGDLFASLSIVVDKPFVIGDFIIIENYMGTVEYVGLKTTRIRSLDGEQIIFSNSDLLQSRVRNYKRMFERRVVFSFSLVYETTPDQLEKVPPIVRAAIEEQGEKVRFDRAHFQKFGDHALVFEAVYIVRDPDFNLYMDIQQAINLRILRELSARDIFFAIPRQTVKVDGPIRIVSDSAAPAGGNGKAGAARTGGTTENRESSH